MDYSEFKRESIVRHQAEKLLDRDIVSFERRQVLDDYEKVIQKKLKKEEEERKAHEETLAKFKDIEIKPHEALDKILKHFNNAKKCSKALVLFKDLLFKNYASLEPEHIFYVLIFNLKTLKRYYQAIFEIMNSFHLLSKPEDKKILLSIFQFIEERKDAILKREDFKRAYRIWSYEGFVHTQIFTDDTYQLNNQIKKTKELIEELLSPEEDLPEEIPQTIPQKPKEETQSQQQSAVESVRNKLQKKLVKPKEEPEAAAAKPEEEIQVQPQTSRIKYDYILPQECVDKINDKQALKDWKRDIVFEITKDIFGMYKLTWAKPAIKQYFDQLYYQRDIFNEAQKKSVEEFKASLSNQKGFDTGILPSKIPS